MILIFAGSAVISSPKWGHIRKGWFLVSKVGCSSWIFKGAFTHNLFGFVEITCYLTVVCLARCEHSNQNLPCLHLGHANCSPYTVLCHPNQMVHFLSTWNSIIKSTQHSPGLLPLHLVCCHVDSQQMCLDVFILSYLHSYLIWLMTNRYKESCHVICIVTKTIHIGWSWWIAFIASTWRFAWHYACVEPN